MLQLAHQGEMFDYLSCKYSPPFSEEVTRYYFQQLITALEHCHGLGIAHRDIKSENLLLDIDYNLLIADFGFSKAFLPEN